MNVLAVDCSTDILAVAAGRNRGTPESSPLAPKHPYRDSTGHDPAPGAGFASVAIDAGYRHAERLMGAVDFCLDECGLALADIDLFACSGGPGSFTGLRIGLSTIKGLAYGTGKPFVLVPTLDAMASEWAGVSPVVVPVIDAKRSRYFWAVYQAGRLVEGPRDAGADAILAAVSGYPEVLFAGPDANMLEGILAERTGFRLAERSRRSPAVAMLDLAVTEFTAHGPAASDAAPAYLRASDAEEAAEAARG
ncbi:MAG TPA: tRNA (adenosine(37)-N6)-threonylcarbamoyltransferase complex dimerization subunit type 1 TsaB [Spirochaetales bacterium]|nr:tRNA (adenosine(37)-N6)-threonylcarbamoyltransferase complex dimerization subunit type 1 TsaB [Spirochaetales bacterium]